MSDAGIERLDKLAAETGTRRSDVIRALLAEALASNAVVRAATKRLLAIPKRPARRDDSD